MNIIIISATLQEVLPFINSIKLKEKTKDKFYSGLYKNYQIDLIVSGIGMVATVYNLTKAFAQQKYDLAVNAGLAGSFKKDIAIGEVVYVVEDRISELGVEDGDNLISIKDLHLNKSVGDIGFDCKIVNPSTVNIESIDLLKKVKGITVNTVHGNEKSIIKIVEKFRPDIETMEGAAFMYVCLAERTKFIQLRAISNFVEKRDKSKWDIPLAILNLNTTILSFFEKEKL